MVYASCRVIRLTTMSSQDGIAKGKSLKYRKQIENEL